MLNGFVDRKLPTSRSLSLSSLVAVLAFVGTVEDAVRAEEDGWAQPRAAMALYLRGLAEEKTGDKTAGEADFAAARAIAPGLAQEYRRFGLAPDAPSAAAANS